MRNTFSVRISLNQISLLKKFAFFIMCNSGSHSKIIVFNNELKLSQVNNVGKCPYLTIRSTNIKINTFLTKFVS